MYIPLNFDKQKSTRFVVETDGIPTNELFSGKVVARNDKAYFSLGCDNDRWVNPIHDLQMGAKPSFIPISKDEVMTKFDSHCLVD